MEPLGLMHVVPDLPASLAGHPVQVLFRKSSSRNYSSAVSLAQKAAAYKEQEIDGVLYHVAAFSRDPKQFMLASVLTDFVAEWKSTIIVAGGRRLHSRYVLSRLAACLGAASVCADPRAHCCQVVRRVFMEDSYTPISFTMLQIRMPGEIPVQQPPPEPQPGYITPCRLLPLSGTLSRHHPATPGAQIESLAKRDFVDICPFFDPSQFQEIENINER